MYPLQKRYGKESRWVNWSLETVKGKETKMDMKKCAEKDKKAKVKNAKENDCCGGSAKKVYQIKGLGAVIK